MKIKHIVLICSWVMLVVILQSCKTHNGSKNLKLFYSKKYVKWVPKKSEIDLNKSQKEIKVIKVDENWKQRDPFEELKKTNYEGFTFSVLCVIEKNSIVPNSPSMVIENDIVRFKIKKVVGKKEKFNFDHIELFYDKPMLFFEKFRESDEWKIILNDKLELIDLIKN